MSPKWIIDDIEFYLPEQAADLTKTDVDALLNRSTLQEISKSDVINGVLFYWWDTKFPSPSYPEATMAARSFKCTKVIVIPFGVPLAFSAK